MSNQQPKKNLFYIGKIKDMTGAFGDFKVVHFENNPEMKDGKPNPYYKGFVAFHFADGQVIKLKSASLKGVGSHDAQRGYSSSIAFDIDNGKDYEILTMIENTEQDEE